MSFRKKCLQSSNGKIGVGWVGTVADNFNGKTWKLEERYLSKEKARRKPIIVRVQNFIGFFYFLLCVVQN